MKKIVTFLILTAILISGIAFANFTKSDWKFVKDITIPQITAPAYMRLKLDNEIAATGNDFKDVRIVSDDGKETPYQLIVERAENRDSYYATSIVDKSVSATGETMFILDLGKEGLLHNRLNIISPSKSFRRTVYVFASDKKIQLSDDGWRVLTNAGYIYRFTDEKANFSAGSGVVNYPDSTSRYLRVVIANGPEKAVEVTSADIYRYEVSTAKENSELAPATIKQFRDKKVTELMIDLGSIGIHSNKLELFTEEINFSRVAMALKSDNGKDWQSVGQDIVFNLQTPKFNGQNLTISYPEMMTRYIKVRVSNEDNEPIKFLPRINVISIVRTAVFEANPASKYSLYYGNAKAYAPKYDIARFFKYLELGDMPLASLESGRISDTFVPPAVPVVPFSERYPNLLDIVLVFLVAAIGVFIVSYLKPYLSGKE